MKSSILVALLTILFCLCLTGQTKTELEEKRKKTLDEIKYVDNMLETTAREKIAGIEAIKIIGSKLNLRESVIRGMKEEVILISEKISLNTLAIDLMENDLVILKNDYIRAVLNSYRSQKGNPEMVYVLSAKDFNQGYKRLKYLQQVAKFRRNESEIILELKSQIELLKERLQNDLLKISDLKIREEQQKELLQREQDKKENMVKSLNKKERQLRIDLEEKKRIAAKIEIEIARIIEAERKKVLKSDSTPEQKLIGENFYENKGRLPWPVERGIITSHFGIQKNAVLKYLTEDNIGIEISSSGKMSARSVFQGEVVKVFAISGANMTIIVRHGKFLSVYANIVNVKVKSGDKVSVKQDLGDIYCDSGNNFNSLLKFMIFETKYLNPEEWILKN
jgi:septal ring factor EnvC (AmiA/AmiB activator)